MKTHTNLHFTWVSNILLISPVDRAPPPFKKISGNAAINDLSSISW